MEGPRCRANPRGPALLNYRPIVTIVWLCLGITRSSPAQTANGLLDFVRPMVGTSGTGQTIPAVGVPFGMTQWTPQTQTTEKKGVTPYRYTDTSFSGIRGTHWISGSAMQDYGSFTLMPLTGKLATQVDDYAAPFSHEDETSAPDYYRITLNRYGLAVEVTGTARCGIIRVTAQSTNRVSILVTPNSGKDEGFVRVDRERREIVGWNPARRLYAGMGEPAGFSGYFVVQFENELDCSAVYSDGTLFEQDSLDHKPNLGACVGLAAVPGQPLLLRVGTSFTSVDAARGNLEREMPEWDFDQVRRQAAQQWESALGRIRVRTEDLESKRVFYTAMYHTLQQPRLFSDVDGLYPRFAQQQQQGRIRAGNYYDDFSMWDIYRAHLPLFEVLQPELVNEWIRSMIVKGQDGGWLPIFPCWNNYTSEMIGDHVTAFIASAYLKGIRDYDVTEAYRLMRQNAFDSPNRDNYVQGKGRRALKSCLRYGYIPVEDGVADAFHQQEQVSRTLEYAYDDYALAQMAKALGKKDDFDALMQRALNYRNVFDTSVGFVRGRHEDGTWVSPFDPDAMKAPYITEGSPRHYTFYVPQDIPGLARLMGGSAAFEKALDALFDQHKYWHGNEPGHQIPFLYNYTASPWKTQREVRHILATEYHDGPDGLKGNDDAGQMSAWYLWAALGLYPVDPVAGEYLLCSPLFDEAVVQLPQNKVLRILCHKASPQSLYIASVELNGHALPRSFITHAQLIGGGTLEFNLEDNPTQWASSAAERIKSSLSQH